MSKLISDRYGSLSVHRILQDRYNNTLFAAHASGIIQLLDRQLNYQQQLISHHSILEFYAENQKIITASPDDRVKVYSIHDTDDRVSPISHFVNYYSQSKGIMKVGISPNGKRIITISDDGFIQFRDRNNDLIASQEILNIDPRFTSIEWLKTGLMKPTIQNINITFSLDSQRAAIATQENTENQTYLFSGDGELISILNTDNTAVKDFEFSPNNELIALMTNDNIIYLYTEDGQLVKIFKGNKHEVRSFSFSPYSMIFSVHSINRRGRISTGIWSLEKNITLLKKVEHNKDPGYFYRHRDENAMIDFHADRALFAIESYNDFEQKSSIEILNINNNKKIVLEHNSVVGYVKFNPNRRVLVSVTEDNRIHLWHKDGTFIKTLEQHRTPVTEVVFHPNNGTFVSISIDGMVNLWKEDGTLIKELQSANAEGNQRWTEISNKIQFSNDGKIITLSANFTSQAKLISTVKWWNDKGQLIEEVEVPRYWNSNFPKLDYSGRSFAIVQPVPNLKTWDLNGSNIQVFSGHQDRVNNVSFSEEKKVLASASNDGTVHLWNLDGQLLKTLKHQAKVNSVNFSTDGEILASASDDNTVKLWSSDGELLNTQKHQSKVNHVMFSPDSQLFASASDDKTVKLWNREGELLKILEHSDEVKHIRFTPNGKAIASVTQDGTLKLWRVSNGKEIIKPIGNARTFSFSPDSKLLFTKEQVLMLGGWWFKETKLSTPYPWSAVEVYPDGKSLVIGHNYGVERLDLDLDKLLIQACGLGKDYLENNITLTEKERRLCDGIAEE